MKKKFLLPILLLATLSLGGGLVACTPGGNKSSDAGQGYGVAISNKEAFAEWYAGTNRDLDLTLTPEANALQELNEGNLTVTSSDETVVKVSGLGLAALKAGTAKITVAYHGAEDSLDVTVIDNSAKAKYGVAHNGTAEDPFTNEDALAVAKSEKYEGEDYYVKGEILSWYHTPGERTDGVVSYFLKPATADGEKFEIYKCLKEDGSALSATEIWKGGIATAHGAFTEYSGQYETTSAKFVKCEGTAPGARQVVNATVAEALTVGTALADGDSEYNYYNITGYVVKKTGTNYFLADTNAAATDDKDMFEIYAATAEGLEAKLLKGAKITIKAVIKNYHGQVETCLPVANDDVTVVTAGEPWVINYQEKTVAEALTVINALADNANAEGYYAVSGVVVAVTTAYSEQYGNISFTIGDAATDTNLLTCFRVKTDAETAAKVVAGAQVVVKGQLQKFVKNDTTTPELINGSVEVIPQAPIVSLAKYKFTNEKSSTAVTDGATIKGWFTKQSGEDIVESVANPSTVYPGANGGSGDTAWEVGNLLKIGKASGAGSLTINLSKSVTKLVVKGYAWKNTLNFVVNTKKVETALANNLANKANVEAGNAGELEVQFSATKELNISTENTAIIISEIEFFGPGEAAAPLKEWDAAATKAGLSNASAKEVKDTTGDVQFTVYKLGTKNDYVEFKFTPTEAKKVVFEYIFTTKASNATKTFFWHQDAAVTSSVKHNAYVNGTKVDAPADSNPSFQDFAGGADKVVESDADDSGKLANPITVALFEFDLVANQENVIKIEYVGSGYSTYVAGARLIAK